MKIVHFVMSGGWGGSEAIAFQLAGELSKSVKVAVVVCTSEHHDIDFYRSKLSDEVALVDASDKNIDVISALPFVPDILHGHLRPSIVRMRSIQGAKKIAHMHMRFYPTQFSEMDAVIAVAPWQLSDVPVQYRGKCFLVPNFMPHDMGAKRQAISDLKTRLNLPQTSFLIGTTGRLSQDKGFDVLIEAMRLVDTRVHCVIAGRGDREEALRRQANGLGNVHFLGFEANIMEMLSGLDGYVSSSRADSFGLSLLEAMHMGLPAIATRTFGSSYLLEHLPDRLVEMEDHVQLAQAIDRLSAENGPSPDYRLDRFDKEASCASLLETYENLLTERAIT